tara:strand:- start:145 stop:516 length:372 start_codon:yes stop_codon:yes gene_type:complete
MINLFLYFWYGKVKLWKAFWIIGFIHGISINYFSPYLENYLFNNSDIFYFIHINNFQYPILDFGKLTFLIKMIIILSTFFVTIGTWRSAEKYGGSFFIILLTLIYLSINNNLPLAIYTFSLFK